MEALELNFRRPGIKSSIEKVREILRTDERARNDDLYLLWVYYRKHYDIAEDIPFREVLRNIDGGWVTLPRVIRARAFIQNTDGQYLSDKQIQKRKDKSQVNVESDLMEMYNGG